MTETTESRILSVSEFTHNVKSLLEYHFPAVWVTGEISNLATPRSGHWYFTLKDDQSQVRCAMFRHNNQRMTFTPREGSLVLVKARVSLYEARGDFQLIVELMEDAGEGALQRAYEQLKQKLQAEGLFAQQHKKALPKLPRRIGIITSPSGAALHDILNVLQRRFPALPVIIYPAQVQGDEAPHQLLHALTQAQQQSLCDVLVIGRGGGSIEDLWAFNNESLARAVYACPIPVISCVGHETDFTICDFVADVRAPTPSAAAELVSPDRNEWLGWLQTMETRMISLIRRKIQSLEQQLHWQRKRLKHPGRYLEEVALRIDDLASRMEQQLGLQLQLRQEQLRTLEARLQQHSPLNNVNQALARLEFLQQRLQQSLQPRFQHLQQKLASLARELDAVSPLATLGRGYALVKDETDTLITSASTLQVGQQVKLCFARDQALVKVEESTHGPCESG